MIGRRKDRAGMGGEPACTQTPKHKQPPVMAHTLNDEPYGIQAFMYEPESETERESEEAETVEETRLQQDVSEW